ncbi:MAG: monofunctional biosynthetic peptidoglycan transglycosylase [Chitinispirillaceae bacterium]|nr:monofunctional biosynthetic peptidoglycan transglycosylase [Chitinispirillaceae bacterium]
MEINKKLLLKKSGKIVLLILKILYTTVKTVFVLYAVLFSIALTFAGYMIYDYVKKPIEQVRYYSKNNPEQTSLMKNHLQKLKADTTSHCDTLIHTFVRIDSISPFLINSVLAAEDDGFYLHPGIDIEAILKAMEHNRMQGENTHGGSTITQQLAKNLFLNTERTYNRKYAELLYSFLLEHFLGKNRILELYMNYAQWGKNIFGCEAASKFYYKKSCQNLTRSEAARLAAVLSMPSKLTPYHKTNYMGKRIAMIGQNLYLHKTINDSQYFSLTGLLPPSKMKDSSTTSSTPGSKKEKTDNRIFY